MRENEPKLVEGTLVSFEEKIMRNSSTEQSNNQKKMNEFSDRLEKLCGTKSNIPYCPSCNNAKVLYQKVDFPLITNNNRFKSVKLIAAVCSGCGEEFINGEEVRHIEKTIELINSYCSREKDEVEPSVSYCDVCESNDIINVELGVYLISKDSKIISVAIQEDYCKKCNAVYYADEGDQMTLEHLQFLFLTQ